MFGLFVEVNDRDRFRCTTSGRADQPGQPRTDATPSRPYLSARRKHPGFRSPFEMGVSASQPFTVPADPHAAKRVALRREEQGARGGGRTRTPCGART